MSDILFTGPELGNKRYTNANIKSGYLLVVTIFYKPRVERKTVVTQTYF